MNPESRPPIEDDYEAKGYTLHSKTVTLREGGVLGISFYAKEKPPKTEAYEKLALSLEVAFNWALDSNEVAQGQGDSLTYGESVEAIEELHTYALDQGMTREEVNEVYARAWKAE